MKYFLPPAVAGALCLPATYGLTRWGFWVSILIALLVVVVMGALGGAMPIVMSKGNQRLRLLHLGSAFVVGALAIEVIGFTYYYIICGYQDEHLIEGVVFTVLEFGGIAAIGGAATCLGALAASVVQRPRRAKKGPYTPIPLISTSPEVPLAYTVGGGQ